MPIPQESPPSAMATKALDASFTHLRRTMCEVTTALSVIADTKLSDPRLDSRFSQLELLLDRMTQAKDALAPIQPGSPDMTHQHTLFMVQFTSLLNVLTPQLLRVFTALSNGDMESDTLHFAHLWGVLLEVSSAFMLWPLKWPDGPRNTTFPLHSAVQAMLASLLHITRQPRWPTMLAYTVSGLIQELAIMLAAPMRVLLNISRSHPTTFLSQVQVLPASLLSSLCCIISDQLHAHASPRTVHSASNSTGQTVAMVQATASTHAAWVKYLLSEPAFLHTFFIPLDHALTTLVATPQDINMRGNTNQLFDLLATPAIVHVCKLILLAPAPTLDPAQYFKSMLVLNRLLGHLNITNHAQRDWSASEYTAIGAEQHSLLPVLTHTWAVDQRLVQVLCSRMAADPHLVELGYMLLRDIVKSWPISLSAAAVGAPSIEVRKGWRQSYNRMAWLCLGHGLHLLQHLRRDAHKYQRNSEFHEQQQQLDLADTPRIIQLYLLNHNTLLEASSVIELLCSHGADTVCVTIEGTNLRIAGGWVDWLVGE